MVVSATSAELVIHLLGRYRTSGPAALQRMLQAEI